MRAVNSPACPPSRKTASLALACLPVPSLPTVEILVFIVWLGTAELPGRAPTGPKNVGAGPYTVKHIQTLNRPRCKPFHAISLPRAAPCILVARTDGDPTASALIYNRDRGEIHMYMYIYRRNHYGRAEYEGCTLEMVRDERGEYDGNHQNDGGTNSSLWPSFSFQNKPPPLFSSLFYWLFSRDVLLHLFCPLRDKAMVSQAHAAAAAATADASCRASERSLGVDDCSLWLTGFFVRAGQGGGGKMLKQA